MASNICNMVMERKGSTIVLNDTYILIFLFDLKMSLSRHSSQPKLLITNATRPKKINRLLVSFSTKPYHF